MIGNERETDMNVRRFENTIVELTTNATRDDLRAFDADDEKRAVLNERILRGEVIDLTKVSEIELGIFENLEYMMIGIFEPELLKEAD